MKRPRVLLLFPPPADCAQPYSSLPLLSAVLERNGCDTAMADLNVELMSHLISAAEMAKSAVSLAAWMDEAAEWPVLSGKDADRYIRLAGCQAFTPVAPIAAQDGLGRLKQLGTYLSTNEYLSAVRQVDRALQLSSVANYPAAISRFGIELPFDIWNALSLCDAVESLASTPLAEWLRMRVHALIRAVRPQVTGISLTYPDQFVPSLIILRAIRAADPSIHTAIGGTTASRLGPKLDRMRDLLHLIDSVVTGDGEAVLPELVRRAAMRRPLNGLPGVIWRRPDNSLEYSGASQNSPMALPVPAYSNLDLNTYWTSEPVLLVNSSRSCYWSRCMFCDVSGSASRPYGERPMDHVAGELEILHQTTGARHFMFGDLAIKPHRLECLAEAIQRKSLPVYWSCQARLEPGLTDDLLAALARAGCRGLVFGMESASQRVLASMDKGTRVADFSRILRGAHHAGIPVNVQSFIGFPGETEEEARATCRFILEHRESISSASITAFKLLEPSRAFHNADHLGVRIRTASPEDMDAVRSYESYTGLSPERAAELAQELGSEIRSAFPIMEAGLSWNAHALLLASRQGPDGLRVPIAKEPEVARNGVRLKPGLVVVRLPFNIATAARQLKHNACGDWTMAGQPTWTVLDRDSARMIAVDERSGALLQCSSSGAPEDEPLHAMLLARMIQLNIVDVRPRPAQEVSA
jgi:hypothetical protein